MSNNLLKQKSPEERLATKMFILDSYLFMIRNSLCLVTGFAVFIYYTLSISFYRGNVELVIYVVSSVVFIMMIIFAYMGYVEINLQKENITKLDTIFENVTLEDSVDE